MKCTYTVKNAFGQGSTAMEELLHDMAPPTALETKDATRMWFIFVENDEIVA